MNNQHPSFPDKKASYFFYSLLLICFCYLLFEYFFIPYAALVADEFVFVRHIYEYTFHLPYRDFSPYKATLGYYLLSLPLFFSHTLLTPLFYIKEEIALINAVCIAFSGYYASLFFNKKAVLLTLLAILSNQLFLIYASDLRVDMLTSWICLFAAINILQQRFYLAGTLLGIAFLISQKALWYFFAMNGGMFICYLCFFSSIYSMRSILFFNAATILTLGVYIVCWSLVSNFSTVFYSLFYEAYIQSGINWYLPIYFICWQIVLTHGPVLFLLWPLTFMGLFNPSYSNIMTQRRLFIVSFAFIALLLFIVYRQPFPYNFVFMIPAFFLLYADFFSWLFEKNTLFNKNSLSLPIIFLIFFYIFIIFSCIIIFSLPKINYFISLFPITIYAFFYAKNKTFSSISFYIFISIFLLTGIFYPLYESLRASKILNGKYQQTMITLVNNLLEKDGDYVSGIPFLYKKDQPIDGLKNLIGPAVAYLYKPSDKLSTLLLPSLYLSPTTTNKVIADFEKTSVKVIINNYRMMLLPKKLKNYIDKNYQHFYGSLYLYSPTLLPSQLSFYLKFTDFYRVKTYSKAKIFIDGKLISSGKIIHLKKGDHVSDANKTYRLILIPQIKNVPLDPHFQQDEWVNMTKMIMM